MKMRFKTKNIYHITGNEKTYNLPKPLAAVGIGRGEHRYEILELFAGFDIETTTIKIPEGRHLAFAYHFQVSIGTPRVLNVYLFRKWDHLLDFFDALVSFYKLGPHKHMILSVFNLGFEFQFLRRRLEWDEDEWAFFAKEKYQPLKATYKGIEFREVSTITGGNLAQLAKDYCYTQKLVGDLDFKKLRNSTTPLDPKTEEQYCINDVVILSEFMWYLFNEYIRPDRKVPMTFTSILQNEIKQELKEQCKRRDDKLHLQHGYTYDEWLAYMYTLQPTEEQYSVYFNYLFRGGYVHGNALFCGVDGLRARQVDIRSDYPARMTYDYYPVTPFKPCEFDESLLKSKCVILHVVFDYVRATTQHTVESKNKVVSYINAAWDNGRLISADFVELWFTELDLSIFRLYYSYAGMTVYECYTAKRGKLPRYVTDVLLRHYKVKEQLKSQGLNETTEYTIAKSRVNTNFGLLCKKIRLEKTTYNNAEEWHDDPVKVDYNEEIKKSILSPFWGIYVTSHARKTLLELIFKMTKAGCTVYYADTDSLKYKPSHKAEQIIKHYNTSIFRHRKNRHIRSEFTKGLGELDKECVDKKTGEHVATPFKMLGAKRYLYIFNGKIKATVAGMPKASINQIGSTPEEIMQKFNVTGYELTPEQSGKLTTSYTDEPYSYNIDGEIMTELSGVALYEIPFTLSLSNEYAAYLNELQKINEREEKYLEYQKDH